MKEERILRVLGEVDETYIGEAAPREIQRKKPVLRKLIIIAACLGLLLTLGCAAVAVSPEIRAAVQSVIETLFPPKEIAVAPEGLPESIPHIAQGQEPTEDSPGFAIYVDEDRYEMTEENGVFFIRPKKSSLSREDVRQNNSALLEGLTVEEQEAFIDDRLEEQKAFYAALPPCEMEIRELVGTDLEAAAAAARTEVTQAWETVTEIENEDFRLSFLASDGTAWDAPQENHYFYPNGERQVYHIIIRYYLEAEEGHGTRLRTMLETFSVIDFSSAIQPQASKASKSMEPDMDARKVYAATLRNLLYSDILPDGSQAKFSDGGAYSQFAVGDVDGDGKEELILLYDSGVMANSVGYIIGYDTETGNIYIQLEEFPFFSFLENGNLKALSSHNQTYGEMWPYILYQYLPESDSYKLAGYAHAEDRATFEANGVPERYPDAADISDTGTVYYIGSDAWGINPIDEADYTTWLEENHGNTSELEIEYLLLTEENILTCEANRDSENRTWQSAYLEIIHHLDEYLAPIYGGNGVNSRSYIDPADIQIYLGIHDFDDDDTFELIVGDTLTMAVFTYKDGQIEKIADLYDPNAEWCINGVHFKDNSISVTCAGAGGSDFVNFGYLDGEYVLGHYNAIDLSEVTINGKESTLEEMNRIYTLDWNERSETERKNWIRLVKENDTCVLKYQSGENAVLNSDFDFDSILW
ncbi:MAG: hypothetical protein J6A62_07945 [Oscillospiraceae bacterium]|nr:hypothetical protein [Oscillospiraceae bacterium]